MNPNREELLFQLALTKATAERVAFLERECGEKRELRARLEALLAAHEQPDTLLATQTDAARPTIKLDFADAPDEAVGQSLGRYKLLERVGEGGCGVVYVAEQTEPVRRRVALKVIKLGMDTKQVVARFEAERQALAMMDHPNIAKVLDAGTTDKGRPYFVMELVRGIRITDYCDQNNLSTKDRLDLFIKVCQAIQHAHQKGVIHRDIKPSNILVTLHDGVPVPKVIDFGIAKATEGRLTDSTVYTQLHQFIGTPAYMSPEQAEMSGLDIDTRSDIYSLGVLLYELLTGRTPFDAQELMSQGIDGMRRTIREREPVRPSTRLAAMTGEELTTTARHRSVDRTRLPHLLRGDLDWIVMKCLEKDRQRRYETANGLAADLKRHLDNEPVIARPPSAVYKLQKAVRRNKLAWAAGLAVFVVLGAGLGVSSALYVRSNGLVHDLRKALDDLTTLQRDKAYEQAMLAATAGDGEAMLRALDEAEKQGVKDDRLVLLRGQWAMHNGDTQEAISLLREAAARMPNSIPAQALLGLAQLSTKDNWQAFEQQLERLRPLEPVSWDDYLHKGQAVVVDNPAEGLRLMDRSIEMRDSPFSRLMRASSRSFRAIETGKLVDIESALEDLIAARPFLARDNLTFLQTSAWTHAHAARLYSEAGRQAERDLQLKAAEEAGRRLEQFRSSAEALYERVVQLEICGEQEKAFHLMQELPIERQRSLRLLACWGNALYRRGRVAEAYEVYEQAKGLNDTVEAFRLTALIELPGASNRIRSELDAYFERFKGGVPELYAPTFYEFAGMPEEARRRGLRNYETLPSRIRSLRSHYKNMARFHAGLMDEDELIELSRTSRMDLCEAHTHVGIRRLAAGDREGAKMHFRKSVGTGVYMYTECQRASILLARLEHDPAWPHWLPAARAPSTP